MKRSTIITSVLLASIAGVQGTALAGDVDITKNRDSHVTVWKTLLGYRYGDPIYNGTLPSGHRLQISEGWLTDLSVEQDPVAAGAFNTTTGFAMVTGGPGTYTMPDLTSAMTSLAGNSRLGFSDLASPLTDIHVTFDLDDYFYGGGHAMPVGTNLFANNGQIAGMPGVLVGLTPFTFDSSTGWTTGSLYTGPLSVIGEMGLAAPTPGSLALAGLSGIILKRRRR